MEPTSVQSKDKTRTGGRKGSLENPEIRHGIFTPPAGRTFVDRRRWSKGMIHPGDKVVRAFAAIGWHWGGYWHYPHDYQHFSSTGR